MSVATAERQFTSSEYSRPPSEETSQSIFESYDPLNEAKLLQKYPNLTFEEKNYYLKENVLSYLEEFVAQVPFKQLNGVLKEDGTLEMMGMNVLDMYKKTADLTGPGTREWQEWQGLQKIYQGLREGNNRAVWISPPKLANYGFVFNFVAGDYDMQLKGRPIKEQILRYGEEIGETQMSGHLADSITDTLVQPRVNGRQTEDFLSSPIIYSHHNYDDVTHILQLMEIDPQAIQRSERIRNEVLPQLEPFLQIYQDTIHQLTDFDLNNPNHPQVCYLKEQAEIFIGSMFNGAKKLLRGEDIDQDYQEIIRRAGFSNIDTVMQMAQLLAHSEALIIQGGSNCPVAQGSNMSQMSEMVSVGFSFDTGIHIIGANSSLTAMLKDTANWKFDKPGKCNKCHKSHQEVGLLGPCHVCRGCQLKFDQGVYK